jgi:hypothetical protein
MAAGPISFEGTLMSGPDIDIIALAGLSLSSEEEDRLWNVTNPRDLLVARTSCEETPLYETDDAPGLSDSYFQYDHADSDVLAAELREAILAILHR